MASGLCIYICVTNFALKKYIVSFCLHITVDEYAMAVFSNFCIWWSNQLWVVDKSIYMFVTSLYQPKAFESVWTCWYYFIWLNYKLKKNHFLSAYFNLASMGLVLLLLSCLQGLDRLVNAFICVLHHNCYFKSPVSTIFCKNLIEAYMISIFKIFTCFMACQKNLQILFYR